MIAALVIIIALTTPEVAVGWSRSLTRVCFPRRMTSSSSFSSHRSSSSPSSSGKDDDSSERITDDEELSNFESIENDDVDEGKRRQLYSYVSRLETVYDNDLIPYILGGQIELAELFPSSLDTTINDDDESTQREQGRQRRVILGDWLDRQEEVGVAAVCVGDSCGDDSEQCEIPEEYKMTTSSDIPKVDVMAFLGIQRAKPITKAKTVFRDWD